MRKYEKVTTTSTHDALVSITCDLCGRAAKGENWDAGTYEIKETVITVEVSCTEGSSYPEGGSGTKLVVDMCPKCFTSQLIPWLRYKGATIKEQEWDW